ncbi:HRDC domain-containing protein [Candidatus Uabimicrobium sp. HlEnr_7]|uniref:HRDC domain-containing protein n=1 Tax=Candidatus Uabimicrobium helgolandensis TaxID=3095367 RepID=UPI00355664B1
MKYQFFKVTISSPYQVQEELNQFCTSHKIAAVEKQFVANGEMSFWAFCITYIESGVKQVKIKSKMDYKEVLNGHDFAIYTKLRALRKQLAQQEGIPVYALFTNEQLATLVSKKVITSAAMNAIEGIGKSRMEKYADVFLPLLQKEFKETSKNDET